MAELTPMMRQYLEIKNNNKDYIVFYRLGDFYEMFFEDAILASKELELVLTGRDCGQKERAPMCGIPYHSAEGYIARLVSRGYKVAICEQTEDPKPGKGIVKREIVRMITPGTIMDSSMLSEDKNNYICSIYMEKFFVALSFADISTGEVFATTIEGKQNLEQRIINELAKFMPSEVLLSEKTYKNPKLNDYIVAKQGIHTEVLDELRFFTKDYNNLFTKQFTNLDNDCTILLAHKGLAQSITGLLSYLNETQFSNIKNLRQFNFYTQNQYMDIDITARRNLELCESVRKEKKGTLLWVLDKTKTPMGSRQIRKWIEKPLVNHLEIKKRQDSVEELYNNFMDVDEITESLSKISDVERLISRIVYSNANAKDLLALSKAIASFPKLKETTKPFNTTLLTKIHANIDLLEDVKTSIDSAISDDAPFSVREGNMFLDGFCEELDELRNLSKNGKGMVAQIEHIEREKTGIKNLKVGYNRVFGYYIEVTKLNSDQVPDNYVRKQTLANCERYIIEELKVYENAILGAQDKIVALEFELFNQLRENIAKEVDRIQNTANAIATLDVLTSFAKVSRSNMYTKPEMNTSSQLLIKDGRHPVVERILKDGMFVANDTTLDGNENKLAIITGPNMAGKSTYMRQIALITIMAQIGCFVPAKSAEMPIVDKVFTRVGASDDLAGGQSTFMVEMSEVATILHNATKNSLILLDEIGRGTSTYDGMSIAKAVVEYINNKIGAKTLFATHYHELTEIENTLNGVKNYNIAVKKDGDNIMFLRKIVAGGTDDSFGIEVAKLAGVPNKVITRAKEILVELENNETRPIIVKQEDDQINFLSSSNDDIISKLKEIDVNVLTPIEAMTLVYELQRMIK